MSRENAPDPVIELFGGLGLTGWYGHRNAYLFYDAGDAGLETTVIGTHLSQHLKAFYGTIQSYGEEGLKPHLVKYLTERQAEDDRINQSRTISMGDGLTAELKEYFSTRSVRRLGRACSSSRPPSRCSSTTSPSTRPRKTRSKPKPPSRRGTSSSARSPTKSSRRARRR